VEASYLINLVCGRETLGRNAETLGGFLLSLVVHDDTCETSTPKRLAAIEVQLLLTLRGHAAYTRCARFTAPPQRD